MADDVRYRFKIRTESLTNKFPIMAKALKKL
jgi:hypothetical protein